MKIEFTQGELNAIKELSEIMELNEIQIIRQALRTYQLITKGHFRLEPVVLETLKRKKYEN